MIHRTSKWVSHTPVSETVNAVDLHETQASQNKRKQLESIVNDKERRSINVHLTLSSLVQGLTTDDF